MHQICQNCTIYKKHVHVLIKFKRNTEIAHTVLISGVSPDKDEQSGESPLLCDPRGGGDSNIKKVGMLVVSLRGVNFRFWSRLGC